MATSTTVLSGQTSTGLPISGGNTLTVNAGGKAIGTILATTSTTTTNGGITTITVTGGTEIVKGINSGTTVNSQGSLIVSSGGIDTGSTVNIGGSEVVLSGGTANNTIINGLSYNGAAKTSGLLTVSAGAITNGSIVNNGGIEIVKGGTANNATINSGGTLNLTDGVSTIGTASGSVINNGGHFNVTLGTGSEIASGSAYSLNGVTINSGALVNLVVNSSFNGFVANSGSIETVNVGATVSNTTVNSGGIEYVSGTAISSVINNGGNEYTVAGGVASGTVVNSGGTETVLGTTISAVINSGGTEIVASGGIASGSVVNSGANISLVFSNGSQISGSNGEYLLDGITIHSGAHTAIEVATGATFNGFTLGAGDTISVDAGGVANSTIINSGANEYVNGTANSTIVNSGGVETVNNGGTANYSVVSAGGAEIVFSGGISSGSVINSGGNVFIELDSSATITSGIHGDIIINNIDVLSGANLSLQLDAGATYNGLVLNSGSFTENLSGGIAFADLVISGCSFETIAAGGTANSTIVNNGGFEYVASGGVANDTVVNSGGFELVESGGLASGSVINAGGNIYIELYLGSIISNGASSGDIDINNIHVLSGANLSLQLDAGVTYSGLNINSHGYEIILSGGIAKGNIVNSGGVEHVLSGGSTSGTVVNSGGVETVDALGSATGTVVNSGGKLIFGSTANLSNLTISDGAIIDLQSVIATSASLNNLNQLVITSGGVPVTLNNIKFTAPLLAGYILGVTSDGIGGTVIKEVDLTTGSVADFLSNLSAIAGYGIGKYAINDSSTNIAANLDSLQTHIANISSIYLTDNNPISMAAAQIVNDASLLGFIPKGSNLTVTDTASNLNGLALINYSADYVDLVVSSINANMTVSGGAVDELDLSHLLDATLTTSSINSGKDTQILVTSNGVTDSIVLQGETPNNLKVDVAYSAAINAISTIGLSPDNSTLIITFVSGSTTSIPYDNGSGSVVLNGITYTTAQLEAQAVVAGATSVPTFSDSTGGATSYLLPTLYNGPVVGIKYQLIDSEQNAVITGSTSNDFIKLSNTTSLGKAVNGGGGTDVIDGGVGSTFVTGGLGHTGDTFFVDGRAPGTSWSTITDFNFGSDQAAIWGFVKGVSSIDATFNDANTGGATGYTGLTLHFDNLLPDGQSSGSNSALNSITLSGHTLADLGVSSIAQLNTEIANATYDAGTGQYIVNSHIIIGQTTDILGLHSYLFIH